MIFWRVRSWFALASAVAWIAGATPGASAHAVEVVRAGLDVSAVASGGHDVLWVADADEPRIGRLDGSGRLRWFARGVDLVRRGGLVTADGGGAWFMGSDKVARIAPDGHVTSYPTKGTDDATPIARGAHGSVWYLRYDGIVGRIRRGHTSLFRTPAPLAEGPIMRGTDGRMWFSTAKSSVDGFLYEIDEAGHVTQRLLPVHGAIAATANAPGGRLYIALFSGRLLVFGPGSPVHVVRLTTTPGDVGGMAVGPDRHLWVSAAKSDRLLRLALDGSHIRRFGPGLLPYAGAYGLGPGPIAAGPRHSMWLIANGPGALARFSLRAHDCTVPNLIGATAAGAARLLHGTGCVLRRGRRHAGWTVRSQSPAEDRVLVPGTSIAASFGPRRTPRCRFPRGSTIVGRGPQARVAHRARDYFYAGLTRDTWWGCVRSRGRSVLLYRSDNDSYGSAGLDGFRVAGTYAVSREKSIDHYNDGSGSLVVSNLRTGRSFRIPVTSYADDAPPTPVLDDYAVGPQGDLLWLIHAAPPVTDTTALLLLRTPAGIRPLAQAPAGTITGLRVDKGVARWSDSGQPRGYALG